MKINVWIPISLLLLVMACSGVAAPVYPVVEKAFQKLLFKPTAQKDLPKEVFFWTSQGAEQNEDPEFKGNACRVDINQDGVEEIMVESEGKLSNQYDIWQKRKGRWIKLLSVWGHPDFLLKRNGYFQVTVWTENRQGEAKRELYAFEGGRYRVRRIDLYHGKQFVRTMDTRDADALLSRNYKVQLSE